MSSPARPRPARHVRQRNGTVLEHLPLVRPIARYYAAHSSEAREDLEQVGRMGLIRAAELYDRNLAVPFSAFARRHIRGAILHYLRDTAPLVRQPRRLQERRQQLARLMEQLQQRFARPPRPQELQLALGLSAAQWGRLMTEATPSRRQWLDLDALAQLAAPNDHGEAVHDHVLTVLHSLEARQRSVLSAVVLQGRSLREAARGEGCSAATAHRLLHAGLAELRRRLSPPVAVAAC